MTAVRALLDARTSRSPSRFAARRKLRLPTHGSSASGATDVLILDVSTTGLLLETAGDLTKGETIQLDFPEGAEVHAVVRWASGQLFGCEFKEPISAATVSRALLRAPYLPDDQRDLRKLAEDANISVPEEELSVAAKLRWIIGLALLSWAIIAASVTMAWRYLS